MVAAIARWIRRFERRIGAHRDGRSPWVWVVPVISGLVAAVATTAAATQGGLGGVGGVALGAIAGAFILIMSGMFLLAFSEDEG